jgi:hypothetical protein
MTKFLLVEKKKGMLTKNPIEFHYLIKCIVQYHYRIHVTAGACEYVTTTLVVEWHLLTLLRETSKVHSPQSGALKK